MLSSNVFVFELESPLSHLKKTLAAGLVVLAGSASLAHAAIVDGVDVSVTSTIPSTITALPSLTSLNSSGTIVTNAGTSPYVNTSYAGVENWYGLDTGSITLNYGKTLNSFSFLWGTPDAFNSVLLYAGSTLVATINGADYLNASGAGFWGNNYTTLSLAGLGVTSVKLASAGQYFEVADISAVAAVPGPIAGAGLLPSLGLGGLALWRRRRAS